MSMKRCNDALKLKRNTQSNYDNSLFAQKWFYCLLSMLQQSSLFRKMSSDVADSPQIRTRPRK